jgi:hypothetical protein
MNRYPPLSRASIEARLRVDLETGKCYWLDATKHHTRLVGTEAGSIRRTQKGDAYWVIKIDRIPYKRAQIVLMVKTGQWPMETVDHKNGNKLDDRADNLRHATTAQNAQNHQRRRKKSPLPMGVKATASGRFCARVRGNHVGVFDTPEAAHAAYLNKRKELFHEFA